MKRCQAIMTEMAACQQIYEQKAFDAEEKLRKWRENQGKPMKKRTDTKV